MNDTAQRRKQVDFTDYLKVGQSFVVKKQSATHHLARERGRQDRLGRVRHDRPRLSRGAVGQAREAGKKAIDIKTHPKDTAVAAALKASRVDAYFGDSPVVVDYISKDHSLAVGGAPVAPIPIGVATRKDHPLTAAMKMAMDALYAHGTIKTI